MSVDHSDTDQFSFSFFCDSCKKEWRSPEKPFIQDGFTLVEKQEAVKLLWAYERRAALNEANVDAHLQFNRCSVCGSWVCDECFVIEGAEGGVCKKCSEGIAKGEYNYGK